MCFFLINTNVWRVYFQIHQSKSYIKSYIWDYANFNPKYAQMAVTILRTYYNFCLGMNTKGKGNNLHI